MEGSSLGVLGQHVIQHLLKRYLQDHLKLGPRLLSGTAYLLWHLLLVHGGITGFGPPSTENVFVLSNQYFIPKS